MKCDLRSKWGGRRWALTEKVVLSLQWPCRSSRPPAPSTAPCAPTSTRTPTRIRTRPLGSSRGKSTPATSPSSRSSGEVRTACAVWLVDHPIGWQAVTVLPSCHDYSMRTPSRSPGLSGEKWTTVSTVIVGRWIRWGEKGLFRWRITQSRLRVLVSKLVLGF